MEILPYHANYMAKQSLIQCCCLNAKVLSVPLYHRTHSEIVILLKRQSRCSDASARLF